MIIFDIYSARLPQQGAIPGAIPSGRPLHTLPLGLIHEDPGLRRCQ
jgi:hypothetical protein